MEKLGEETRERKRENENENLIFIFLAKFHLMLAEV
jgi:hypothetical protein